MAQTTLITKIPAYDEKHVLEKCNFYSTVQLWPVLKEINPVEWLSNFEKEERYYALHLLSFFMYFSSDMVNEMLYSGIHNISNFIRNANPNSPKEAWEKFVKTTIITPVYGEKPNTTDSGYTFARKARDYAGFDEECHKTHEEIIDGRHISGSYVLFVDDFVGTGGQIRSTLERKYGSKTFAAILKDKKLTPIYSPLMCTTLALKEIKKHNLNIKILPVHIIDDRYSVFSKRSLCWNGETRLRGIQVLRSVSARFALPTYKADTDCWRGFGNLGLAIAFEHGVPDATLPIYRLTLNDMIPLVRKKRDDQI